MKMGSELLGVERQWVDTIIMIGVCH